MGSLLQSIQSPNDVKKLEEAQLQALCQEIREKIIDTVAENGGHLASNLGVVELTVALHRVFTLPEDTIVWDVGHQSYTHKLLTGRADRFHTIRTENGLSGFPDTGESECDRFTTGHSSASISAALGVAAAKGISGQPGHTIAVIGDGALTGGLAYEGLNNAGRLHKNMIVVLNDNTMSISRNVGSMARYLAYVRAKPSYLNAKDSVEAFLCRIPKFGGKMASLVRRSKNVIKKQIFNTTIFEDLGFHYYGPFDGHDLKTLTSVFTMARDIDHPVLIHVRTNKGRGYKYAEERPVVYHGPASFDKTKGVEGKDPDGFSGAFGLAMCRLAQQEPRLCAITAAMKQGTGLSAFSEQYKDRFFDVGIAEEHAVTFAGGLAAAGMIPVFAVYSTFLQRSYDQLVHDAALQKVKMILAVDRAGLVGEDGKTHQGVFDPAFLRTIPGIQIYAPSSYGELDWMLERCVQGENRVYAIRYPRGKQLYLPAAYTPAPTDWSTYGDTASDTVVVCYGRTFSFAAEAAEALAQQGVSCCVVKLNRIYPTVDAAVRFVLEKKRVLFFEEAIRAGGIGEAFGRRLQDMGFRQMYEHHALEDAFVPHGKMFSMLARYGLDADGIRRAVSCEGGTHEKEN